MYYKIESTLKDTPLTELLRAYKSNKEYLHFDISVFNVGASIWIKCTDKYIDLDNNKWNGYDFIIQNDRDTNEMIEKVIISKLDECKNAYQIKLVKNIIKNSQYEKH